MGIQARQKKNPRHPGDIGDIGDIFRKSLILLGFLQVPSGDIFGDIFGDGDFRAQDTIACACFAVRFGDPDDKAQNGPLRRIHGTNARRPGETSGSHICAQDTLACVPRRSIRCYRGTPLSGNPYYEQRARRRCADQRGAILVVPTTPTVSVLATVRKCRTVAANKI